MSSPLVSVIVPNYNHARFLARRIESVISQTFGDFELILMDDCSTDDSLAILRQFSTLPQTRLLLNDTNSGSTFKQWKKGVGHAAGKYVWLAESDDYAGPDFLRRMVQVLEAHPRAGIAFCQSNLIDEQGRVLRTTHRDFAPPNDPARWERDFIGDGREECARELVRENVIPNASGAVFRRQVYLDAGGVDDKMRLCGDWKLWVAMLLRSDLAHLTEPMNFFRFHGQSVRAATRQWQTIVEGIQVVQLIEQSVQVPPGMRRLARNRLADAWINAWLHRRPVDIQERANTLAMLRGFDPSFDRRLLMRAASRGFRLIGNGQIVRWIAHVLQRSGNR